MGRNQGFPLWTTLLVELEPMEPNPKPLTDLILSLAEHRWILLQKHSFPVCVAGATVLPCKVIDGNVYVPDEKPAMQGTSASIVGVAKRFPGSINRETHLEEAV